MKNFVNIFKALADETRLRVIKLLQKRELCVCELMQVLGMSQPRISRHLTVLKNAGLVDDRREGRWIHYSLRKEALQKDDIKLLLKAMLSLGNDDATVKADQARLGKTFRLSKLKPACNTSSETLMEKIF